MICRSIYCRYNGDGECRLKVKIEIGTGGKCAFYEVSENKLCGFHPVSFPEAVKPPKAKKK